MSREEIQQALMEVTHQQKHLPEAFCWASDNYRGGRSQVELVNTWDHLALEERVGLAACLIGIDNRSDPAMVIRQAYYGLCCNGALPDLVPPAKVADKDETVQHGFDIKQSFRHRN